MFLCCIFVLILKIDTMNAKEFDKKKRLTNLLGLIEKQGAEVRELEKTSKKYFVQLFAADIYKNKIEHAEKVLGELIDKYDIIGLHYTDIFGE
jgi:hypothetical protein